MEQLQRKVESLQQEMLQSIKESVAIPSVQGEAKPGQPFGAAVAEALEHALGVAGKMGLKTKNLDGYIGYAEYGDGEEYVAVLGHLDVVPEGDGWQHPPFGCEVHDGKMYGRGVLDDKGPLFAALYGLKAVKELGLPLSKRVRIIFGTNEETGCLDAAYYTEREPAPAAGFTPDASFPVIHAEKGIVNFELKSSFQAAQKGEIILNRLDGGRLPNMVPDYCEAVLTCSAPDTVVAACSDYAQRKNCEISAVCDGNTVNVTARGLGAHGSTPELGVNAAMLMVDFLQGLQIAGGVSEALHKLQKAIGEETNGASLGIACQDEPSGLLTNNLGILKIDETSMTATCNVRYPVTLKFEDLLAKLEQGVAALGLTLVCRKPHLPLYFPKDHPLVATLLRIFEEQTGIKAAPLAIGGGTYAKTMSNVVAYGPEFPGTPGCCHEPNEQMALDELLLSAKIYAQAIYELAR
ncbi:dipeptidase PepV [Azotosporobacter soli]|uniref:dipeptidase PepV n=1 Tax=Azotosporobacter soli TaxID=3055040 RepID=UPI0031FF2DF9